MEIVEERKKELEGIVGKEEGKINQVKKSLLSPDELKAFEAKEAEDKKNTEDKRIQSEAIAKKDAELLLAKDEDIKEEADKKRKLELVETKRKEEEGKLSADDKIKRVEEKSQKRIDELVNQLKEIKDKSSKTAESMQKELEALRKEKIELAKPKDDVVSLVLKEEKEKQSKYLQEDKSLSREDRREIDDAEIDDWLLENQKEAIAWIQRRELRREIDKRQNLNSKVLEGRTKELFEKQFNSLKVVMDKHPDMMITKRRDELKSQGKSDDEITETLRTENKKYDLSLKISEEHPEWKNRENAPELVMVEMEKRLDKSQEQENDNSEIAKLLKRIEDLEADKAARENSDEGVSSTIIPRSESSVKLSEQEEMMIEVMRGQKMPKDSIDAAISDFRKKKGIKK